MALSYAMTGGAVSRPQYAAYLQWKRKASPGDQASACACVGDVIRELKAKDGQKRFSLATAFPEEWPSPLTPIWEFWGEDKLMAALILGCVVMDCLIDDEQNWMCFKTDLQDRGFDTNFYWCDV